MRSSDMTQQTVSCRVARRLFQHETSFKSDSIYSCRHMCWYLSIGAAKGEMMERIVNLHIEKLPEGVYLATSTEVQGLIAQGRTIQETIEIAQDVAKRLIEAQEARHVERLLPQAAESFDYPMIVNA